MQNQPFPTRSSDYHRLLERMASVQLSDDEARRIITSKDAHRQFVADLCNGMTYAAGKHS